jgi:hypothetical protein
MPSGTNLMLVECPHCSTRVLPMGGRICPSCRKNLDAPPEPAAPEIAFGAVPGAVGAPELERSPAGRALDPEAASASVRRYEDAQAATDRLAGQRNMLFGALWCCGGIAVTALTFRAAANSGGGRYIFAGGAILFGAIQFIRGLIQSAPKS